jgi:hypothetical protein
MLAILLLGCTPTCDPGWTLADDGNCYQAAGDDTSTPDDTDGSDSGSDSDDTGTATLPFGDPISQIGTSKPDGFVEFVDVAVIDDDTVLGVGQGGWRVISLETGEVVAGDEGPRVMRAAVHGRTAAMVSSGQIFVIDVDDPTVFQLPPRPDFEGMRDVDLDDDYVIVAAGPHGARIMDLTGKNELGHIDLQLNTAVAAQGDRVLVSDRSTLHLVDVSDPSNPDILTSLALATHPTAIDWVDDVAVVGIGSKGVAVVDVGETLSLRGTMEVPSSVLGVSLDDDWVWIAAWNVIALGWLGGDEPVIVGHQPPVESAMGIAGRGGRAIVGDWFTINHLFANGRAAPEQHLPGEIAMVDRQATLSVTNWGVDTLEMTLEPGNDLSLSTSTLALGPGESEVVALEFTQDVAGSSLTVTSNDPDEGTTEVRITRGGGGGVGSSHPPMQLDGFAYPDSSLRSFDLADHAGEVAYLVYWAVY